ncbi:MAG: A24 family peptidase [Roseobacter sp.]
MFFWLLLALAVSDLLWFRLPDFLNASLALTAFALAALPGGNGWEAVWGAIIGFGAFFAIRFFYQILRGREGLGFGDVKLMIGLGAFIGPVMLSWLIFLAASATLAIALLRQANRNGGLTGSTQMPFGAALCAAAFAIWVSQLSSFN